MFSIINSQSEKGDALQILRFIDNRIVKGTTLDSCQPLSCNFEINVWAG